MKDRKVKPMLEILLVPTVLALMIFAEPLLAKRTSRKSTSSRSVSKQSSRPSTGRAQTSRPSNSRSNRPSPNISRSRPNLPNRVLTPLTPIFRPIQKPQVTNRRPQRGEPGRPQRTEARRNRKDILYPITKRDQRPPKHRRPDKIFPRHERPLRPYPDSRYYHYRRSHRPIFWRIIPAWPYYPIYYNWDPYYFWPPYHRRYIFVSIGGWCPPEPDQAATADYYFEEGVKAFESGDYVMAAVKFQQALELAPDDIVLPFAYIQALFANKQYEKAGLVLQQILDKLDEIDPEKMSVFYPYGLYSDEALLKEQIEEFSQVVKLNPLNANLQFLLGYQLFAIGRLDESMECLEKACLDKDHRQAASLLIGLLKENQKKQEQD